MFDFVFNNVDSSFEGFQRLIDCYSSFENFSAERIKISCKSWFAANLCSPLGGVLDYLIKKWNTIEFDISNNIRQIFQKNDFFSYYGFSREIDNHHTTVPYLKLRPSDGRYFQYYIRDKLINRTELLPRMTRALQKKISESIYEIFVNAQLHSDSDYIYCCGQFYPKKNIIEFTVSDMGVGFRSRVNQRFGSGLTSVQAIKWALIDGNSTKKGISGGIGLAILTEFIKLNRGKIQIVSGEGFYEVDSGGSKSRFFNGFFPGTIINLQVRTDDKVSYSLSNEIGPLDNIF